MKQARSGTASENLQEILDAEATSIGTALNSGQQQYLTPDWLADQCNARLPNRSPSSVIDPQCGEGALIQVGNSYNIRRFGIDIDNRIKNVAARVLIGNCVKAFDIIDDLHPELRFECANANPPFGKRWKVGDKVVDSTKLTWDWVTKHANFGYFIANHNTLVDMGIASEDSATTHASPHPWVFHYEVHAGNALWKGMRDALQIGIAFWKNPAAPRPSEIYQIGYAFDEAQKVLEEEKASRPDFNIYLDHTGYLRTYLSVRSTFKLKLSRDQIARLHSLNACHPLTLTTEKQTRDLMKSLVECGIYTIQPEARAAIEAALSEVELLACPIMPVTPFESVAYADEEESLTAITNYNADNLHFTAAKHYKITTGVYKFSDKFTRNKVHFNEESQTTYTQLHECSLSGQDRYIAVNDDRGRQVRFMDRPRDKGHDYDESLLWKIFQRPAVKTSAEAKPGLIETNLAILKSIAMLAGFEYYPGQMGYLPRVATKDCGLVAAETGTGKTLMALSLLAMKSPVRALIIAPQGTMRSSDPEMVRRSRDDDDEDEDGNAESSASQWIQEIHRFTPYLQVWELFSYDDYERICSLNGGKLPPGVYVSYYQAMFSNGAREKVPDSWDDKKLNQWAVANGLSALPDCPPPDEGDVLNKRYWCERVGREVNGIRSIITPCLSTLIGSQFDMCLLDEAHCVCNLLANITQMLIRLQPRYRWALTATPIPNIVSNLFSLIGWLAVPEWYKGERRNAAWPYAREEIGRFDSTFLSNERDHTQEDMKRRADPEWSGKCEKNSPVISSPARLLKLLKPNMAFISKQDCNPNYIKPEVIDVRVPMGHSQAVLYGHFLNRANVPGGHPLVRARRQTAWLRNICADPAGFTHGGPSVPSNLNPKVLATLELVRDLLPTGQVLIISSRVGLTTTLQHRLAEAGVPFARIDSTMPPDQHAFQANLFKSGRTAVLLMGIKCAAAYSFDDCNYEIITSLEYSYGPFEQAKGRVDRLTNKVKKKIFCILHKGSLEEIMYDVVATKGDAATICLRGERVPREYKPVDAGEVMAAAVERFDLTGHTPERECETRWPQLREAIRSANLLRIRP